MGRPPRPAEPTRADLHAAIERIQARHEAAGDEHLDRMPDGLDNPLGLLRFIGPPPAGVARGDAATRTRISDKATRDRVLVQDLADARIIVTWISWACDRALLALLEPAYAVHGPSGVMGALGQHTRQGVAELLARLRGALRYGTKSTADTRARDAAERMAETRRASYADRVLALAREIVAMRDLLPADTLAGGWDEMIEYYIAEHVNKPGGAPASPAFESTVRGVIRELRDHPAQLAPTVWEMVVAGISLFDLDSRRPAADSGNHADAGH